MEFTNDTVIDESSDTDEEKGETTIFQEASVKSDKYKGRKGNESIKNDAFNRPIMTVLKELSNPCSKECPLGKMCTIRLSTQQILSIREAYFGIESAPAPSDSQRAKLILELLRKSNKQNDSIIFTLADDYKVKTYQIVNE